MAGEEMEGGDKVWREQRARGRRLYAQAGPATFYFEGCVACFLCFFPVLDSQVGREQVASAANRWT